MWLDDLRTDLLADADLAAIIGTRTAPAPLGQGATLPAMTFSVISRAREYEHEGYADLQRIRVQFDCWSTTNDDGESGVYQAQTLADALIAAIEGLTAWKATIDSDIPEYEPETRYHRRIVDALLWVED